MAKLRVRLAVVLSFALSYPALCQSFVEFPVSYPQRIVSSPDGTLWFTKWPFGSLGRITIEGALVEDGVGSGVGDLAVAADGSVWAVLDMELAHLVEPLFARFPVPNASSGSRIAVGPDENIWFTAVRQIGRCTPAGLVTAFSLPADSGSPVAITAGPDGNLWFTESINQIGRITPTGAIDEFSLPDGSDFGGEITKGSDGAVWFTLPRGRIGRITTAGTVSEFAIPRFPPQVLDGITLGPDGNVWFTEASYPVGRDPGPGPFPNRVGRITPNGAITEFDLPNSLAYPVGIAAGSDGNIWVAEFMASKIARISPLLPCAHCTRNVSFR